VPLSIYFLKPVGKEMYDIITVYLLGLIPIVNSVVRNLRKDMRTYNNKGKKKKPFRMTIGE